ncbi:hypothetical protein ACLGIH_00140 [Streptomyces sp. HMX87]|uniref:hypothetical protein n=1 Tax=Streptomyces sp. HMX87 TaxID=3390849 RepID=UPI003A848329
MPPKRFDDGAHAAHTRDDGTPAGREAPGPDDGQQAPVGEVFDGARTPGPPVVATRRLVSATMMAALPVLTGAYIREPPQ